MISLTPNLEEFDYLVSVDIGIRHLALLLLEYDKTTNTVKDLVWFELIDITKFHHLDLQSEKNCIIPHSKTISDWLQHLFHLHHELFALAKNILIERQPIQGHVAIEQLFFHQFRDKAILIHPRSVHRFFNWNRNKLSYEQRKVESVKILQYRLERTARPWLKSSYEKLERKHDISDAYIQAVFFLHRKQFDSGCRILKIDDNLTSSTSTLSSSVALLNKFQYTPYVY